MLFVTHDIAEAVFLADRVDVVDGGRIAQEIAIALPAAMRAAIRYTARFAGTARKCARRCTWSGAA